VWRGPSGFRRTPASGADSTIWPSSATVMRLTASAPRLPQRPALGLHPWIVLLVILVAPNLCLFPYQFLSYATLLGGSENRLFTPRQVRGFCLAYMALALVALLAAIPLWRFLRLLG
jgi:hypothetical protein